MTKKRLVFAIVLLSIATILLGASIYGAIFFFQNLETLEKVGSFFSGYNIAFMFIVMAISIFSIVFIMLSIIKAYKK